MKNFTRTFLLLLIFSFLNSCAKESELTEKPELSRFTVYNNTSSHFASVCSDGQTLTFSIQVGQKFESAELGERSSARLAMDIEEGDELIIQVRDESGGLILGRNKVFNPSNPEVPLFSLPNVYRIAVCDTRVLEIEGF